MSNAFNTIRQANDGGPSDTPYNFILHLFHPPKYVKMNRKVLLIDFKQLRQLNCFNRMCLL